MANQELLTFVKQELARGITESDLKASLSTAGWPDADISEAFSHAMGASSAPQPFEQPVVPVSTVLLGAPALLGKAWALYKQRWATFLAIMIPSALLSILITVTENMGTPSNSFIFFGSIFVVFLLAIILSIWSNVALLHAIKGSGEQLGVTASFGRGSRHILSFLWISILTSLVVMGGVMLLIVPGIIFAIWFMFGTFVLVDDDTRGMNALLKSREYVRGRWGGVAWRIFFIGLIFIPIFIALGIFSSLLKLSWGEHVVSVLSLFITPLMMTYLFVLYENLKATRGSFVFAPTGGKKHPLLFWRF